MINTTHTSSVHSGVTGNSYCSAETTFNLIIIYGEANKKMMMKHRYTPPILSPKQVRGKSLNITPVRVSCNAPDK